MIFDEKYFDFSGKKNDIKKQIHYKRHFLNVIIF